MKLLILLFLTACTQKYQTYHIIDKHRFDKNNPEAPITKKQYPGYKTRLSHCKGQIFFMSNAQKQTDRYLHSAIKSLCPKSNTILNSRLTETWWTTIIYSRSCVELEGYCPRN